MVDLHSEHTHELGDTGLFLEALRDRFKDVIRQRGRSVADYVRDFCQVVGKLRAWPERLLVHHFRVGLDRTLCQACAYWDLPHRLNDWYQVATELDAELRECRPQGEVGPRPWRFTERSPVTNRVVPVLVSVPPERAAWPLIQCLRCGQPIHRTAECPALAPQAKVGSSGSGKTKKSPRKIPEKSRAAFQVVEVTSGPGEGIGGRGAPADFL